MSYQEKKTLAYLVTNVPVLFAYGLYAFLIFKAGGPEVNDLSFWAKSMLIFMAIGVAIAIVSQIVLHIGIVAGFEIKKQISTEITKKINQELPMTTQLSENHEELDTSEFEIEDEMEKIIQLKAMRIGYIIAGFGFLMSLIVLALKMSPAIMLNVLFFAFGFGSLTESLGHLYYYRRGL
jgi:hypothetical protein